MSNSTESATSDLDTSTLFTSSTLIDTSTSETPTTTSTTPTTTSTTPTTTSTTQQTTQQQTTPTSTQTTPTSTSSETPDTSVALITSVVTASPTAGGTPQATTIIITSTASAAIASGGSTGTTTDSSAAASSSAAALASDGSSGSSSGGLSAGGKIAVAVVVPIVAIAVIAAALLFFWKKRKARKHDEELRKKEMEEYGFNPNNDPTLPAVGAASVGDDSEIKEDGAGYRGWGATSSTNRKASTTLSSGRGFGMAPSDEGSSNPGGYAHPSTSPNEGIQNDYYGNDPYGHEQMNGGYESAHISGDYPEAIGTAVGGEAAGNAAAGGAEEQNNDKDIHRGLSNASSGYSGAAHSEGSEDTGGIHGNHFDYYNDIQPAHGPYGDGSYGGGQPVIRDVQARRNTRIEKPTVFPQQGNSGIAANF